MIKFVKSKKKLLIIVLIIIAALIIGTAGPMSLVESLDAVFLTHFHNDHIADLGEVIQRSYMLGREKELLV